MSSNCEMSPHPTPALFPLFCESLSHVNWTFLSIQTIGSWNKGKWNGLFPLQLLNFQSAVSEDARENLRMVQNYLYPAPIPPKG